MARLSVAVLGTSEVRHGRQILAFPTRRALAILVYVLIEGGTHRRDECTAPFRADSDTAEESGFVGAFVRALEI